MKLLHTADLHLGGLPAIGKVMPNGLRERENDSFVALDYIKSLCKKHSVDGLIIAGDTFETPNPNSTLRREWSRWLRSLEKETDLKFIIDIDGNHDTPNVNIRASALATDSTYLETGFVKLSNGITTLRIPRPTYHFAHEPVTYVECDDDETLEGMGGFICVPYMSDVAAMREWILKTYEENEGYCEYFVLVGHLQIAEAVFGNDEIRLRDGVSINDEIFKHPKLVYGALGHIHAPQSWMIDQDADESCGAKIVYPGSLVSKDYNDASLHRRVAIVDIERGEHGIEYGWQWEEIPDRNYITIVNGEAFEELPSEVVQGSFVKLKFKGTKQDLTQYDTYKMTERLYGMGAFQVSIDMIVVDDKHVETDEIASADSIPAACVYYIDNYAPDHLDKGVLINRTGERL